MKTENESQKKQKQTSSRSSEARFTETLMFVRTFLLTGLVHDGTCSFVNGI